MNMSLSFPAGIVDDFKILTLTIFFFFLFGSTFFAAVFFIGVFFVGAFFVGAFFTAVFFFVGAMVMRLNGKGVELLRVE